MTEVIAFEHLALSKDGPMLTMSLASGQSLALICANDAGKASLLRIIAGQERPARGSIKVFGRVVLCSPGSLSKRSRIQAVAGENIDRNAAAEALNATGLWDCRTKAVGDLSKAQVSAAELLEALTLVDGVALIDGQLDDLDPWTLDSVLRLMRTRLSTSYVICTRRPDIAEMMDALLVLKASQLKFAGTPEELIRSVARHHLTIGTEKESAVRALVEPFAVDVKVQEDGIHLTAAEGQELAAKLLLEGYGDVRFVIDRPATLAEALLSL